MESAREFELPWRPPSPLPCGEPRTLEFPCRATGTGSLTGAPSRWSEGG